MFQLVLRGQLSLITKPKKEPYQKHTHIQKKKDYKPISFMSRHKNPLKIFSKTIPMVYRKSNPSRQSGECKVDQISEESM